MTGQLVLAAWFSWAALGTGAATAPKSPAPTVNPEPPWAKTPQQEQDKALELFEQANQLFYKSETKEAVARYREALSHWDHPAFRYNLAIALLTLSNALECHQQLELATRYGPGPLEDPEKFKNAMTIMAEVEAQLSRLDVSCDEPEAQVKVDGREGLLSCPGSFGEWTQPGIHAVQITKEGFYPTTKNLNLKPGEKYSLPLKLYTVAEWTRNRSRWPGWVPGLALGGGGAALALAGGLHAFANQEFQAYDKGIVTCTGKPPTDQQTLEPCDLGTRPELDLRGTLDRANLTQNAALALYGVGAATLATGIVLFFLNFPQPYLVDPESGSTVAAAPMLAPGSSGVVLVVNF